ncbi:Eukaryotic translation initiation factor 3 subunit H-B (eIF3h-B) (Eukaryotic translation initiation factor 3 subunit 3-B) (eIF-3-gamma-B) (eIF3 p40 subunit B), partial [Durusdinium trenchii]
MVQKSVVLVYDPFQTKKGHLAIKAYRLSDAFMKVLREHKSAKASKKVVKLSPAVVAAIGGLKGDGSAVVASNSEADLGAEELFEEVPIEITNSHLFTVLIEDLKERNGDKL